MTTITIDRSVVEQALMWFEWSHKGNSIESPASSHQCSNALRAALAEQPAEREPEGSVCGRCGGLVFDPILPQPAKPAERVPLTDEELRDALRSCPHDTVENLRVRWLYAKDFARAVEAAHGIK